MYIYIYIWAIVLCTLEVPDTLWGSQYIDDTYSGSKLQQPCPYWSPTNLRFLVTKIISSMDVGGARKRIHVDKPVGLDPQGSRQLEGAYIIYRDLHMQVIPTLDTNAYKCYVLWATWIPKYTCMLGAPTGLSGL